MALNIVFVDGDVEFIRSILPESTGIKAEFFTCAEDALTYLAKNKVKIVVTDLPLPDMGGVAFLRIVQNCYPNTFRVVLSALEARDEEALSAFRDRTIEQWFYKAPDMTEFLSYLRQFISDF